MSTYIILVGWDGQGLSVTPPDLEVPFGEHEIEWHLECDCSKTGGANPIELDKDSIVFKKQDPFKQVSAEKRKVVYTDKNQATVVTRYEYTLQAKSPGGTTIQKTGPYIRNRPS